MTIPLDHVVYFCGLLHIGQKFHKLINVAVANTILKNISDGKKDSGKKRRLLPSLVTDQIFNQVGDNGLSAYPS